MSRRTASYTHGYRFGFVVAASAALVFAGSLAGCGKPAARFADQSTPQSAARSAMEAIEARDGPALAGLFDISTPAREQFVAAMADLLSASNRLQTSASNRFGREEAKQLSPAAGSVAARWGPYEAGAASVQGDDATLTSDDGRALRLRREGGAWKVVPDDAGDDAAGAARATSGAARVLEGLAGEIDADYDWARFPKIEQVRDECARRMRTLLAPPATGGATKPAP